jgi:hypothetical protein
MTRNDRRRTARFDMEIPLAIRTVGSPDEPARMALSSNISASGLYVATDLPLKKDAPVEISMRMPEQVTGKPAREWRCVGRVVRVEPFDLRHAKPCVGVEFQYYEVIPGPGARFQN